LLQKPANAHFFAIRQKQKKKIDLHLLNGVPSNPKSSVLTQ
jgi:hypothetical protein